MLLCLHFDGEINIEETRIGLLNELEARHHEFSSRYNASLTWGRKLFSVVNLSSSCRHSGGKLSAFQSGLLCYLAKVPGRHGSVHKRHAALRRQVMTSRNRPGSKMEPKLVLLDLGTISSQHILPKVHMGMPTARSFSLANYLE